MMLHVCSYTGDCIRWRATVESRLYIELSMYVMAN